MKKLLAILFVVVLMFSFAACGDDSRLNSNDWKEVLEGYEEFMDEYIEATKSGKDLTELDKEGEKWAAKIDELGQTLEGEEKEEFQKEAARITMKVIGGMDMSDLGDSLGGNSDNDLGLGDYGDSDLDFDDYSDDDLGLGDYSDELNDLNDAIGDLEDAFSGFDY